LAAFVRSTACLRRWRAADGGLLFVEDPAVEAFLVLVGVIVGGAIGVLAPVAKSYVDDYLARRRVDPLAEARKALLRQLLEGEHPWRTLETLQHVIGADADTTRKLLLEIGARASEDGQDKWGLISRNPLSKP
jgi:hypothetical protein